MFRTSYVHHQEGYIVHTALCVMLFKHLCKQFSRLKDVHGKHTTQGCMYNIVFLMMDIRCSKHVEDKKNLTL